MYVGYTICTSREYIVYGGFCGSTMHLYDARIYRTQINSENSAQIISLHGVI